MKKFIYALGKRGRRVKSFKFNGAFCQSLTTRGLRKGREKLSENAKIYIQNI
jgi:hypothetical protein